LNNSSDKQYFYYKRNNLSNSIYTRFFNVNKYESETEALDAVKDDSNWDKIEVVFKIVREHKNTYTKDKYMLFKQKERPIQYLED
jgi:hypothetical protein